MKQEKAKSRKFEKRVEELEKSNAKLEEKALEQEGANSAKLEQSMDVLDEEAEKNGGS